MAQSRFSALLRSVQLFFNPGAESKLSDGAGHQFNVSDASPKGAIGHQFAMGTDSTDSLGHEFDVNQIHTTTSGLFHQFDVDQIHTSANVSHQFDVNEITASGLLGHTFGVEEDTVSGIGHTFLATQAASGLVGHEFDMDRVHTSANIGHEFNIDHIDTSASVGHQLGVQQSTASGVGQTFGVHQPASGLLGHEFDLNEINTSALIGHQFDVDHINTEDSLGHSFGMQLDDEDSVGHTFGHIQPDEGETGHSFGIYGIILGGELGHQFNVPEINDYTQLVGHSFGLENTASGNVAHQFKLAYTTTSGLGHSFTVSGIYAEDLLGHQFLMNNANTVAGHQFSAIGAGVLHAPVSHQVSVTYALPSDTIQHQFRTVLSLDFTEVTHSGEYNFVYEDSNASGLELVTPYDHIWGLDTSYASLDVNTLSTSSGTWTHIDPLSVEPSVASGLQEADFFHGSFVFNAEPENLVRAPNYNPSGETITIPEYESDTIYLRQSWLAPVSVSGLDGFWNLNDFPLIPEDSYTLTPGESPFPPFFGRQITVSGDMREHWGLAGVLEFPTSPDYDITDPLFMVDTTDVLFQGDPFTFHFTEYSGDVKRILEKDFIINGIYISRPNGEPGTTIRRGDTAVRLGFTIEDSDFQPELLEWSLGVELPAGIYDQVISTDRWILDGMYRDFVVAELEHFDNICGRIRGYSPNKTTDFTGYPPEIIQMSSEDLVRLWGAGIVVWPDYIEEDQILELCIEIIPARLRNNIPTLLKIREEAVNSTGKLLKFYNDSGLMRGEHIVVTSNTPLGEKTGTLLIDTKSDTTYTVSSNNISQEAITVYKKESRNSMGKWALLDEESE